MSREVSFDGANTEVFGNSVFNTEDTPLTLEDLGEEERHVGGFQGLRQNGFQRPERILNKRPYNLPDGTSLKFPYKSLANIVLGANKDVKFHRSLTSRANAEKYAANRRLRLGPDADFNDDGVNDVVLFDRYNNPVVINGFALANSEYPYKKTFYETYPKKSQQMAAGGYGNWVKGWIPSNKERIEALAAQGFKKKSISNREPSIRQNLSKAIKDNIEQLLRGAGLPDDIQSLIKSILPWFQIFSILYDDIVLRRLIDILPDVRRVSNNLDEFKKLLKRKEVKKVVDRYMKSDEFEPITSEILSVKTLTGIVDDIIGTGGVNEFVVMLQEDFADKGIPPNSIQKQLWKEEFVERANDIKQQITYDLEQKFKDEA